MNRRLIIFGAGGHAKVVIDAVERTGKYEIAFIADADQDRIGSELMGYPVKAEKDALNAIEDGLDLAFVAIGNNKSRGRIATDAKVKGGQLAKVIHPEAVVSEYAQVGAGTLVMPASVVNASAIIGENVVVNTGSIIEHDCRVGDDAHIAPRATLCGGVTVGDRSLIGAGAIVLPGVVIGCDVTVGAGAVVVSNVPDGLAVKGNPAR